MPNPTGENGLFAPEPVQGEVVREQALAGAAPISGTPIPGSGTTQRPATVNAPPAPAPPLLATPYVQPPGGVDYYKRLSATWQALARMPGAGEPVKQMARQARTYADRVKRGAV